MTQSRFDPYIAHATGTESYAPLSDSGSRPPKVHWAVDIDPSFMAASPPGAHIRAEVESVSSSRVTMRDTRPDHGHAHIADVTVWATGSEPLTEETIAVASAIYWSWWRALDMRGEAP